jgi:hypothetical protein
MNDAKKKWRAAVIYRGSAYLVGYFDAIEDAQAATERSARMSEEPVHHLEVDECGGECWRQIWGGRSPRGDWYFSRRFTITTL